jgi:hypothetical protein
MKKAKHLGVLLAAASLLAMPEGLLARSDTSAPAAPAKPATKDVKQAPTTVKQLADTFNAQRQAMIKQRQEVLQKLKAAATPAERQKILAEAKKNDEALIAAQRDLAKQIQTEIKTLREQQRGPPAPGSIPGL